MERISLLRGNPCAVYNSDMRLQLSKSCYVYPDVMVSCDHRDQEHSDNIHYPCIVIEVLSPSTEVTDRIKKLAYYRECPSIQEYVMIDSQKYLVDLYRRESEGWILKTLSFQDTFVLKSIGAHILVEEIYEKISFQP
jgi:Uma2 family endonuclease